MIPEGFYLCLTLALGLCLGSFATALSHRLPRGISIVKKERSACPACGHDLGVADLVPVFSWLFLKGRCRFCRAKIGLRYPLIEVATTLLCLGFYLSYGFTAQTLALFALAPVLVSIVDIDLHHKIIPDGLNLSVLLAGIGALALSHPDQDAIISAVAGMALYALLSALLRKIFFMIMKREPMGLGDVKFFAAAGFWLGLDPDAAAAFMILSGACGVLLALAWKKISGEEEFPFGPALVLALAALIVWRAPFLI